MAESFLDEFLKYQLLDIGDDDGRFENLENAAETVCDQLKNDVWQLARYLRVGLDKDIDPDEPVLDEIEAVIKEHWRLIRNKHTERPVSIIRAVLWEAVCGAVDQDEHATIIALTSKSESADANMGPEVEACERFLNTVVQRVERLAEVEWSDQLEFVSGIENGKLKPVNTELLAQMLLAACGPNGSEGPIEGANPHWPSANDPWSIEFSNRAAKGIAHVIGKHTSSAQSNLNEVAQELSTEIRNARLAVSRKTDLLWWSQSRFCITMATPFSEIATSALPFFLAADIQNLAPGRCPQSVDHFLAHVVQSTAPKAKKITIRKLIETLLKEDYAETVGEIVQNVPVLPGRCSLLSAVKQTLDDPAWLEKNKTNLSNISKEFTLTELAKRIFWELKAESIAESVEPVEPEEAGEEDG